VKSTWCNESNFRPQKMDSDQAHEFRLLSDEDFRALSTAQKIAYLKRAIEAREAINRQVDASLALFRQKT
jgi:hypothetical protein